MFHSPAARRLLVTIAATAATLGVASSASALSVIATTNVGTGPMNVAFSPDGALAYVTNQTTGSISVIDTASHTVAQTITGLPSANAISIVGATAAVSGSTSGTPWVKFIDLATNTVTGTAQPLNGYAPGVALHPNGASAWATATTELSTIDTTTATITGSSIPNFVSYTAVALNPAGTRAWVTSYNGPYVRVFDITTVNPTPVQTISGGGIGSPVEVAIAPNGQRAYVADCGGVALRNYDTTSYAAGTAVPIAGCPWAVAINPAGTLAFVTRYSANKVTEVDLATGTAIATVDVGGSPQGAVVSPDGSLLYVVNNTTGTVSVIAVGRPDAPTSPSATAGDGQATVSWTAPAVAGGTPITTYTASVVGNPLLSCTATAPATSCTITGLTNDTAYAFTVTATNGQGTSAASAASSPVTPRAQAGGAAQQTSSGSASTAGGSTAASLAATLLPSRSTLRAGQSMRLAIRARNTGGTPANGVTACMRMPTGLVITGGAGATRSNGTACFAMGTLAAGAQATRTMTVRAAATRRVVVRVAAWARGTNATRAQATPVAVRIVPRPARVMVTG